MAADCTEYIGSVTIFIHFARLPAALLHRRHNALAASATLRKSQIFAQARRQSPANFRNVCTRPNILPAPPVPAHRRYLPLQKPFSRSPCRLSLVSCGAELAVAEPEPAAAPPRSGIRVCRSVSRVFEEQRKRGELVPACMQLAASLPAQDAYSVPIKPHIISPISKTPTTEIPNHCPLFLNPVTGS